MSRRKAAPNRIMLADPLFGSELIAKFINAIMSDGKKSVAEKIVYGALERVARRGHQAEKDEDRETVESISGTDCVPKGRNPGVKRSTIRTSETLRKAALDIFDQALENLRPAVEVRSRRVGGSTYQIPVEVRPNRRTALAMRWLRVYAAQRGEKNMADRLAGEILDASHGRGNAAKKREDVHRMAKANQAFAHYRW